MNITSNINNWDGYLVKKYNSVKEMLLNRNFFTHTIRFCNKCEQEKPHLKLFLYKYFGHDGYIDSCKIPLLLFDIYSNNRLILEYYLKEKNFKNELIVFLNEFYNWTIEVISKRINLTNYSSINEILFEIKINQKFLIIFHNMLSHVLKNILNFNENEVK